MNPLSATPFTEEPSLLAMFPINFEYNKTLSQIRRELK